ncbi:MAG: glycosyltransferase family 2 protein [Lachnospiraceae bacterium]|nr:glycosyltransferase family 2 protein [Lachnospiraceae bacterium]
MSTEQYGWSFFHEERLKLIRQQNHRLEEEIELAKARVEELQNTTLLRSISRIRKLKGQGGLPSAEAVLQSAEEAALRAQGKLPAGQDAPGEEKADRQERERKEWDAYETAVFRQAHAYYAWQEDHTPVLGDAGKYRLLTVCREDLAQKFGEILASEADYVILTAKGGFLDEQAAGILAGVLERTPDADLLYGDEDFCDPDREAPDRRGTFDEPWLKPDYSPDTLLGYFYFGNAVIFSKELFGMLSPEGAKEETPLARAYDLCLQASERAKRIVHIPEVLFHNTDRGILPFDRYTPGIGADCVPARERALSRRKVRGTLEEGQGENCYHIAYEIPEGTLVSAVILTKDHPEILEKCLKTFRERTTEPHAEIIVVDNGSAPEAKALNEKLRNLYDFQYIYEPAEFNFSAMCNRGIREAKGQVLLLLNDDIEILEKDWLRLMTGQALQPGTGCVGAKLIYAGTDLIQHAGVAMLRNGPSHKMVQYSDDAVIYHGMNRATRNVLAVTAACLAVERRKLESGAARELAEGFPDRKGFPLDESFRVAYNDVELCLRMEAAGYRNVLVCDAVLWHHESLTRGMDIVSAEKWKRLTDEQERLFARYPRFRRHDPYDHPHLVDNATGYFINHQVPWGDVTMTTPVRKVTGEELQGHPVRGGKIRCKIDAAQLHPAPYPGSRDTFTVSGWAMIPGEEIPLARKELFLEGESGTYAAVGTDFWRPDVAAAFPETKKAEMCGFFLRIAEDALPEGTYRIGIRLGTPEGDTAVQETGETLEVRRRTGW